MSRRYVLVRAVVRAVFALTVIGTVALAVVGLAFLVWSPCAAAVMGGAL